MHLKVVKVAPDPPPVLDHHVPVFLLDRNAYRSEQWDLTTQQVIRLNFRIECNVEEILQ